MTTPQPSLPGFRTSIEIDLMSLPLVRPWMNRYRSQILANNAARREGKVLLFGELAEALRHGMPLDDALAASSQTLKESKRRKGDELRNGANSRDGIFQFVITGLLLIQFFILGLVLYFAAAMRLADPERIARLFAIRLRAQVVRGKSLSEAMASLSRDFDPSEVEIVRAGEGMNQLPRALANLSKFLLIRKTIGDHGSVAIYPLMIVIMLAGAAFFTAKIIPNYVSIFKQMGARSSFPTSLLFQLSEQSLFFQALMILLPLVMLLIIFRGLLNGRMMSSHILAALTLPMLVNLVAGTVQLLVTSASGYVSVPKIFESRSILLLLSLPIALMWLPTAMERIESVVRSIEQYMARILSKVPILGVGAAAEMEARWLAAFSLSIESGAAAHEAIISAGTACGGGLKTSSDAAAARVVSGVDVGEACEKAQLPSKQTAAMIAFAARSDNFIDRLRIASQDRIEYAERKAQRTLRVAQTMSVMVAFVIALILIPAVYMPLFNMPTTLGR